MSELMDAAAVAKWSGFDEHTTVYVMAQVDTDGDGFVTEPELMAFIDAHTYEEHPTSVYIAYARNGDCLYVGITGARLKRFHAHAKSSAWWRRAKTVTLEHYPSRAKAEAREIKLIRELRPKYNVMHAVPA